ncbi:rod shape-determining protein RodA [Aerococcus urinaehominis]|uniref:Rod shape-determining protein RodA n=2 Tax=Aerococcus urinaehominis TaxID=128944 RepID=A0A0X8FNU0_9LACT|nr:FtsW/RodA/SpoVE family cell cycle protein [Aerococcus urinaehominis]AMC00073.1 rod shape-determining protein RodA [Aerococcus urinaehominis]
MRSSHSRLQRSTRRLTGQASRLDLVLVLVVLALACISITAVYATTYHQFDGATILPTMMHTIWYVVGIMLALVVVQLDRQTLYQVTPALYWFGILLLILVLLFYDRDLALSTGARSWFKVGPVTFQPSEFMKLAYILQMGRLVDQYSRRYSADIVVNMNRRQRIRVDSRFLMRMLTWSLLPFSLVLLQNDFGTMLVFLVIFVGTVFVSGITWAIILPAFIGLVAVFAFLLFMVIYNRDLLLNLGFKNYQFARIDSWLEPFGSTANESYQLAQSIKAIGSGGFFGKGFGEFEVYVPVRESDMIFATIGENFGFLGSVVTILLLFLLIYQMVSIAFKTHDAFYIGSVSGIVSMLTFHVIENIGMSIGLLPLTGIPLPFISMGGSALVMNLLCVGFVLSIKYQAKTPETELLQNPIVRLGRKIGGAFENVKFLRS